MAWNCKRNGLLGVADLYGAPFTLRVPQGPEELFADNVIGRIADVPWLRSALDQARGPLHLDVGEFGDFHRWIRAKHVQQLPIENNCGAARRNRIALRGRRL